jgi:hypothetical protein
MLPRLAVAFVLLFGALAFPARPAAAAQGDVLSVSAGFGGLGVPGSMIPVRVRIAAERLVAGSVEVSVREDGGSTAARVTVPVEVAGGSVKEYVLIVPTPLAVQARLDARLAARSGDVIARQALVVQPPRDEELVGLLPAVLGGASLPGPAPLAVDAGVARFFTLDESLMARAPESIESLGTVGLPADGMGTLAAGARAGLLRWVRAGGRLLVDAAAGAPVDGVPDEWQPGADGRAAVGRGEIVQTGGAMASGRWAGLVEPTLRGKIGDSFIAPRELVQQSVAEDAGLTSRGPGWLMGFLLLYVVVAGPVTFIVLRRRRREELAWAVIPVVAVLFTTGSYVEGRQLRAAGRAHASVIVSGTDEAGGSTGFSYVHLVAQKTETGRIRFPQGWTVRIAGSSFEQQVGAGAVGIAPTRSGQEASIPLNSGQAGLVLGSGPVAAGSGLSVTARVEDGKLQGVVRNGTPFSLDRTAVVIGSRATGVGSLGAGEERPWSMEGEALLPNSDPLGPIAWPGMAGGGLIEEGAASYGLWQAVQAIIGRDEPAPGNALAVGWTRDYRPQFVVNGRPEQPPGRTMVLASSAVRHGSGALPSLAVARDQIRGSGLMTPGAGEVSTPGPAIVRFELPEGSNPARLVLRTLSGSQVDVWRDGAWRPVDYGTGKVVDETPLQGNPDFSNPGPMLKPGPPVAVPPAPPPGIDMPEPVPPMIRGGPNVVIDGPVPVPWGPNGVVGSMLVDYDVPVPPGSVVYVRILTPDGVARAGSYTWLRGAQA